MVYLNSLRMRVCAALGVLPACDRDPILGSSALAITLGGVKGLDRGETACRAAPACCRGLGDAAHGHGEQLNESDSSIARSVA